MTSRVPHDRRSFIAFLVGLLTVSTVVTQAQSGEAILHLVDSHYNRLTSLRARYTERYTGMGLTRSESGTLTLRKPGRMRWDYDTPTGKLFLLDGKSAWFYTPGDTQAQRISAKQIDDLRTPLRFLLGHTQIAKELTHIAVKPLTECTVVVVAPGTGCWRISGIPLGMEARVKSLILNVTSNGQITAMRVEELDGSTTAFTFTEITENIPTRDSDFTFTPPPGVTVISGPPPI